MLGRMVPFCMVLVALVVLVARVVQYCVFFCGVYTYFMMQVVCATFFFNLVEIDFFFGLN